MARELNEVGVVGLPKTTGNRGVHVYVRLEPRWDSYEVRLAAVAVARELERRRPDLLTAAWWKEERGERIFVDYNQNARDHTIASAYSVRRTPRATVSTPVTWAELADVAGWDLLASLSETLGHTELAAECRRALAQENLHAAALARWLKAHAEVAARGELEQAVAS